MNEGKPGEGKLGEERPAGAAQTQPPAPAAPRAERPVALPPKRPLPWRLILVGAFVVYAVIFVILNADTVSVSFVFFTTDVSLVVALVLALLIGFFIGYLFDALRDRRRRRDLESRIKK